MRIQNLVHCQNLPQVRRSIIGNLSNRSAQVIEKNSALFAVAITTTLIVGSLFYLFKNLFVKQIKKVIRKPEQIHPVEAHSFKGMSIPGTPIKEHIPHSLITSIDQSFESIEAPLEIIQKGRELLAKHNSPHAKYYITLTAKKLFLEKCSGQPECLKAFSDLPSLTEDDQLIISCKKGPNSPLSSYLHLLKSPRSKAPFVYKNSDYGNRNYTDEEALHMHKVIWSFKRRDEKLFLEHLEKVSSVDQRIYLVRQLFYSYNKSSENYISLLEKVKIPIQWDICVVECKHPIEHISWIPEIDKTAFKFYETLGRDPAEACQYIPLLDQRASYTNLNLQNADLNQFHQQLVNQLQKPCKTLFILYQILDEYRKLEETEKADELLQIIRKYEATQPPNEENKQIKIEEEVFYPIYIEDETLFSEKIDYETAESTRKYVYEEILSLSSPISQCDKAKEYIQKLILNRKLYDAYYVTESLYMNIIFNYIHNEKPDSKYILRKLSELPLPSQFLDDNSHFYMELDFSLASNLLNLFESPQKKMKHQIDYSQREFFPYEENIEDYKQFSKMCGGDFEKYAQLNLLTEKERIPYLETLSKEFLEDPFIYQKVLEALSQPSFISLEALCKETNSNQETVILEEHINLLQYFLDTFPPPSEVDLPTFYRQMTLDCQKPLPLLECSPIPLDQLFSLEDQVTIRRKFRTQKEVEKFYQISDFNSNKVIDACIDVLTKDQPKCCSEICSLLDSTITDEFISDQKWINLARAFCLDPTASEQYFQMNETFTFYILKNFFLLENCYQLILDKLDNLQDNSYKEKLIQPMINGCVISNNWKRLIDVICKHPIVITNNAENLRFAVNYTYSQYRIDKSTGKHFYKGARLYLKHIEQTNEADAYDQADYEKIFEKETPLKTLLMKTVLSGSEQDISTRN